MSILRRFALLTVVAAGFAVFAGPVFAARAVSPLDVNTLGTPHFLVHFQSDLTKPANITQIDAGWIAASAERAYTAELGAGYAAPLSDGVEGGDARTDIYIDDLSATGALGVSIPDDAVSLQSSGYIILDGTQPADAFSDHTIAHELFHLIQFGVWSAGGFGDSWLYESSAEWMGYRATNYDISGGLQLDPADISLDCSDPNGLNECDTDPYTNGGYSRWGFVEYLSEKFGSSFVKDVFAQAVGAGSAINGLSAALTAKGTTLADTYDAWSTANMSGAFTVPTLQAYRPQPLGTVSAGASNGTFLSALATVNHLSTEYVAFTKGDNDDTHPCFAATLSLTVTMPAGTQSKPAFFWDAKGSTPVQLAINGNVASASIPWDTCTWLDGKGYLSVPNASQTVDAADFLITASLTVDETKPVTATPPPDFIALPGVVSAPSADMAPTVDVFGPELLTLSATTQQIRLIVASSGPGTLQARLGTLSLGTQKLRAGNNDVRFTIPKGTFTTLRTSAAAPGLLTLTPAAPNGGVSGLTITRKISITPVAKTVKKTSAKKAAAKKKAPAKKTKAGTK